MLGRLCINEATEKGAYLPALLPASGAHSSLHSNNFTHSNERIQQDTDLSRLAFSRL